MMKPVVQVQTLKDAVTFNVAYGALNYYYHVRAMRATAFFNH